jgi:hypothetical protein
VKQLIAQQTTIEEVIKSDDTNVNFDSWGKVRRLAEIASKKIPKEKHKPPTKIVISNQVFEEPDSVTDKSNEIDIDVHRDFHADLLDKYLVENT